MLEFAQAAAQAGVERRPQPAPSKISVALPWRTATIVMAVMVAAGALVITALPSDPWEVHHMSARVAIDAVTGVGAFAAAWLVRIRYKNDRSAASWFLMAGLGVYALAALCAFTLSAVVALNGAEAAGALIPGRLVTAILLACAAVAPLGPMRRPPSLAATTEFGLTAAVGCVVLGILLAHAVPDLVIRDAQGAAVGVGYAAPAPIALTSVTALLYMLSGVALWRRARAVNDATIGWLAIAAFLGGASRLDSLLLVSTTASLVSAVDLVKLAATAALVGALAAEFRRFEQRLSDAVSADERRRLARELHDGLAQDLAFIASHATSIARRCPDQPMMREIAYAAERAMGDSRRAIHLLNRPRSRAVSTIVAERAYELCERSGLELEFAMLGGEVHVTPEVEHAAIQIVSEAVSNAAKHSGARSVTVELSECDGAFAVLVSDDGCGFDLAAVQSVRRRLGGFGLTSMDERVRALGGDFRISSCPGGGTTVEVTFR